MPARAALSTTRPGHLYYGPFCLFGREGAKHLNNDRLFPIGLLIGNVVTYLVMCTLCKYVGVVVVLSQELNWEEGEKNRDSRNPVKFRFGSLPL